MKLLAACRPKLRGCELNVKVPAKTVSGTRRGIRRSQSMGISPPFGGEKGPRQLVPGEKPYLGTLWGNGRSMYAALA